MNTICLLAALLPFVLGNSLPAAHDSPGPRVPVLLELFTSEGCSSCPPADRLLAGLDEKQPVPGAELIVLSEHVDYWNQLGWKDPFSSPVFSARQQEYTDRFHMDGVYTPQLIVDGASGFVGSDSGGAESAIRKAIREEKAPMAISHVSRDGARITAQIELPQAQQALQTGKVVLYLAVADNRVESHVGRGENAGRSLTHVAVVRAFDRVGVVEPGAGARDVTISVPSGAGASGLRLVAFLQDSQSGRVVGVAARKL